MRQRILTVLLCCAALLHMGIPAAYGLNANGRAVPITEDPMYERVMGLRTEEPSSAYDPENRVSARRQYGTGSTTYSGVSTRALKSGETLRKGIDVSDWQGSIDWSAVAKSGVEFAMIRVAVRGYGEKGTLMTDDHFRKNLAEARANGIRVGAYIFSQAITQQEAREEASYLMNLVKGYQIDLPLVFDYEYAGDPGRLKSANLSKTAATGICNAFCAAVEQQGYQSMVYAGYYFLQNQLNASKLGRVWLANYTNQTDYPGAYEYWQFSSNGRVPGIATNVDLDFWFEPGSKPSITGQPAAQNAVAGKTAGFTVSAKGDGLSYQWQVSKNEGATWTNAGAGYSGAQTASLSFTAGKNMDGCLYRCVVKNSGGSVTSKTAKLTVIYQPSVSTQPKAVTVSAGAAAGFTAAAAGNSLRYQWQVSKDSGKTWNSVSTKYPSATTSELRFGTTQTMDGYLYRCLIQNSAGSVTTNAVKLTVSNRIVIAVQPKATAVTAGGNAAFKVKAYGGSLTYQWQVSKDGGATWKKVSTKYPSAKTAALSFAASLGMNGNLYRCTVTNSSGSATTKAVKLTVEKQIVVSTQPAAATFGAGKTAKFTVKATGGTLRYQWQVSKDGGRTWKKVSTVYPSAKTRTLTFPASKKMNGYRYRCVISNQAAKVITRAVKLTVK